MRVSDNLLPAVIESLWSIFDSWIPASPSFLISISQYDAEYLTKVGLYQIFVHMLIFYHCQSGFSLCHLNIPSLSPHVSRCNFDFLNYMRNVSFDQNSPDYASHNPVVLLIQVLQITTTKTFAKSCIFLYGICGI